MYLSIVKAALKHVLLDLYKDEMIAYMHTHPELFQDLISLAVGSDRFSPRAAWLLSNCVDEGGKGFASRKREILRSIEGKSGGHQRDLVRVLSKLDSDDEEEGLLFDQCVALWSDPGNMPSVRHVSMRTLLQITEKYPELYNEVKILLKDKYLDSLSAGVRRSILRMKGETEKVLS